MFLVWLCQSIITFQNCLLKIVLNFGFTKGCKYNSLFLSSCLKKMLVCPITGIGTEHALKWFETFERVWKQVYPIYVLIALLDILFKS